VPLVQQGRFASEDLIDQSHALLAPMDQARDCKAVQVVLIVMEGSTATMKDWQLQMVPAILDISARSVLSDPTLSLNLRVEECVPGDITAQEKQLLHSNVLLARLTIRPVQQSLQTALHVHQGGSVRAMVTLIQMDCVMRAGTVKKLHTRGDLFLKSI